MKEPTPAHEKIRFRRKEITGWHAYPSAEGTPLPDRRRLVPRWLARALKWTAIGVTSMVVVIAALNLVLDFDFIEEGAEMGAPKYMEWYGAFGLLVTLIWLYLEILRLLAKLQDRR